MAEEGEMAARCDCEEVAHEVAKIGRDALYFLGCKKVGSACGRSNEQADARSVHGMGESLVLTPCGELRFTGYQIRWPRTTHPAMSTSYFVLSVFKVRTVGADRFQICMHYVTAALSLPWICYSLWIFHSLWFVDSKSCSPSARTSRST